MTAFLIGKVGLPTQLGPRIAILLGLTLPFLMIVAVMFATPPEGDTREAEPNAQQVSQGHAWSGERPAEAPRFEFRGEQTGVIFTPSGSRTIRVDPAMVGSNFFTPHNAHRGLSVYVPYGGSYESSVSEPVVLGATYEIVSRGPAGRAPAGAQPSARWEMRAREVVIPGEFVEVFHPAVYEVDENGDEHLVEKEETTRVAKVRIVLERKWVTAPGQ